MKVRELRARPRSFFETEFRMDGADSKRVLHTRLADEDDEATAAGRVTTSCLQFLWIKRDNNFSFFWKNKRVQEAKHCCSAYLHTGQ
jgi:hypothetical protein